MLFKAKVKDKLLKLFENIDIIITFREMTLLMKL